MSVPYTCCDCDNGECTACPYANGCPVGSCRAKAGQRCRHPSGHTGPLIFPHADRMFLCDVDAIADHPDQVYTALRAHGDDTESLRGWIRNLTKLRRFVARRRTRIKVGAVDALLAEAGRLLERAQAG